MRIALICDDYLPDSTRVSAKMMHELACELVERGHEPIVITPSHRVSSNYIVEKIDAIDILRFSNGKIKDVPKITRAINEMLLSRNAWNAVRDYFSNSNIDGVIYYSPSIFFGSVVKKIKTKWSCSSYLILRDSFPQWIIDEGLIKDGSLVCKCFRYFERINYSAANYIGVMSERNKDMFITANPSYHNVGVLYNWSDAKSEGVQNVEVVPFCIKKLLGKTIFLYGGNIGKAQDMGNLIRLVSAMKMYLNVHFLFIGQGDEYAYVNKYITNNNLHNITLIPSISQSEFKTVLKYVHVGLFSLSKKHSSHNFPGKLLGYMQNNLPILGSVNKGNDLAEVINCSRAGCVYDNGADDDLFKAAIRLATDTPYRLECGRNANKLLHKKFSVTSAVDNILKKLTKNQ